jgi:multidrug efflux pump
MNAIIDAAITHARTVLSCLTLLFLAGSYAYVNIAKESSPDIDIPLIYISVALEGISPDDAERLLIRPLEQELSTVEGVKEMTASSYQGGGFVLMEFNAGFDKDSAKEDVQEAVDKVRPDLPDDVEEPAVNEVNFSLFPVLVVTLSGEVPERTLLRLARDLQDKIESIPSVLEAKIAGNREELLEILVKPELIESYGLNGVDILQFFGLSNRLVAAGNLDTGAGRFAIKVPGLFENAYDVLDMPLRVEGDSAIKVGDIAQLRRTFKDPESFARINGERAIALEIVKRSGENIIDTIENVKKIVRAEQELWPGNIEVFFTQDESTNIRSMLLDLQNNVISAILLVMIIVIFALGVRSALLVGIAIPGSFLTGILFIYLTGLTVNIVVLFSLILSVGMLVDGAIVVTEYADRKMAEGHSKRKAYGDAAKRMAWPITASTFTTLAAFAPLLFWPDTVGEFMKYMPITLIAVLSASLLMALVFVPTIGALIGKAGATDEKTLSTLQKAENGNLDDIEGFTGFYIKTLKKALRFPGLILLTAIVVLVGVIFTYGALGKGVEFFPNIEPERAAILVHARGNLSIFEQNTLLREVEYEIAKVKGIETYYTRVGKAGNNRGNEVAEDVIGQIQLQFDEWDQRKTATEILDEIRDRTEHIAGIHIETQEAEKGPPSGKAVQIQLASRYPERLDKMADLVLDALDNIGDFRDIEDSRPLPGIEWEMMIDRAQAKKFGIDLVTVGYYIRMVTNGLLVAEYRPNDSEEEIDIVIRHGTSQRTLDQLDLVRIETQYGSVPISNFVKRVARPAVSTINRADQRRIVTIKADLPKAINTTTKVNQIKAWVNAHKEQLDPMVDINFKGEDEDQKRSQDFLSKAFIVALFMMAIILVTQFNSFSSALLILSAVIMSTVGVMIGLLITQQPFGIIMSGVGVIALAGIIVNNNIVLIDTFDHLKRQYGDTMSDLEIILRTGAQRLRPVLLTTVTTVIGLMPMVMQLNIDFITREISIGAPSTQWWVQLATAIAYGLSFSTILTLVVTPCALMFRSKTTTLFQRIPFFRKEKLGKLI